jgi:hypothetical protein
MAWEIVGDQLINSSGISYDLHTDLYWYLAPSRTTYTIGEKNIKFTSFGLCLHNAAIGEGLVCALSDLLVGIEPTTMATSLRKIAEETLEKVRQEHFPNLPSRYRCFYLNSRKEVAEYRSKRDFFGQERLLTSCYVIRNSGRYHFGDIRIYETLTGQPEDTALAFKYWEKSFIPTNIDDHKHLEILADSALYFPDWRTFTKIDPTTLVNWQLDNSTKNIESHS